MLMLKLKKCFVLDLEMISLPESVETWKWRHLRFKRNLLREREETKGKSLKDHKDKRKKKKPNKRLNNQKKVLAKDKEDRGETVMANNDVYLYKSDFIPMKINYVVFKNQRWPKRFHSLWILFLLHFLQIVYRFYILHYESDSEQSRKCSKLFEYLFGPI